MARKLTKSQIEVLRRLSATGEWENAYRLRARLDTMFALLDRGLVESRATAGSIAFPATVIMWRITDAGRKATADLKKDNL